MDTVTVTLTEFLLARIAEDEAGEIQTETVLDGYLGGECKVIKLHTRVDPSPRVLAECAAKRAIMGLIGSTVDEVEGGGAYHSDWDIACALARIYADRPDFNPEWRL